MTEAVFKTFEIVGNGKMHDVGARPKIYSLANSHGVMVVTRNTGRNKIEVVAKGGIEDIELFHKSLGVVPIRPLADSKNGKEYTVGKLEEYDGKNHPEFAYFASSLTLEQVSKGTEALGNIHTSMEGMRKDMQGMRKDMIDVLPGKLAEAIRKTRD